MDTNDKIIIAILSICLFVIIFSAYHIETIEKKLAEKTIEAENWKTLYQLSEK